MRRGEGPKVELRFLISTKVISSPCFRTFLYEVIKCHFVSYFLHTFNLVFRISNFRNTPQVGIHSPNNFCVVPKSDVVFFRKCTVELFKEIIWPTSYSLLSAWSFWFVAWFSACGLSMLPDERYSPSLGCWLHQFPRWFGSGDFSIAYITFPFGRFSLIGWNKRPILLYRFQRFLRNVSCSVWRSFNRKYSGMISFIQCWKGYSTIILSHFLLLVSAEGN